MPRLVDRMSMQTGLDPETLINNFCLLEFTDENTIATICADDEGHCRECWEQEEKGTE